MAIEKRNWANGGRDHDGKALLPMKRVEKMRGFSVSTTANIGAIQYLLNEAIKRGEEPTTIIYGGRLWNSKHYGIVCQGKYYALELEHDPEMEDGEAVIK